MLDLRRVLYAGRQQQLDRLAGQLARSRPRFEVSPQRGILELVQERRQPLREASLRPRARLRNRTDCELRPWGDSLRRAPQPHLAHLAANLAHVAHPPHQPRPLLGVRVPVAAVALAALALASLAAVARAAPRLGFAPNVVVPLVVLLLGRYPAPGPQPRRRRVACRSIAPAALCAREGPPSRGARAPPLCESLAQQLQLEPRSERPGGSDAAGLGGRRLAPPSPRKPLGNTL
mmetsp:Transcript_51047/g.165352  ORF Transcript_51047/g.165352 Transcript_51047/m.165352 type:complete len:233 (-) Transcript_51047:815-1513(-)